MEPNEILDDTDIEILDAIQSYALTHKHEVTKHVNISMPTVSRRLKRLIEKGIITGPAYRINWQHLFPSSLLIVRAVMNTDESKKDEVTTYLLDNKEIQQVYEIRQEGTELPSALLIHVTIQSETDAHTWLRENLYESGYFAWVEYWLIDRVIKDDVIKNDTPK